MDIVSYDNLLTNTKLLLSKNVNIEAKKSTFTGLFSSVLEDCGACIIQSLDLVLVLISDTEVNLIQLCKHLENAVNILKMLCGFLTEVLEAISMNCSNMKTFPTATGRIILSVFSHCKDSESIYGHHLKAVEKQLKELFRNCHELQLTYLMSLGKHFIFDLTEHEQLCILIEALDINLKIGEIAQTLDVKTMAEQWKAYTAICEKYSDFLKDRHIYEECTKILCKMIENNVQIAAEIDQEDKITLRSIKIASFAIKILLRVCIIFRQALEKNFEHIAELLLFVYLYNSAYLESVGHKSAQFINLVENNINTLIEALVKELSLDENFYEYIFKYELESFSKTEKLLSYILTIISAMKSVLQGDTAKSTIKHRILDCIYQWLPYGHIWFNMGLKFSSAESSLSCGLYEHLLTTTFAMATTFSSDDMNYLERKLYESLLGTESYSALFSSNLWDLLARSSSRQFLISQVLFLCKVFQTLESEQLFLHSPQKVYISQTLRNLFERLNSEDKTRILKQFVISDRNNYGLWSVLEIRNVGFDKQIEEQLVENVKRELCKDLSGICPEEIETLIKLLRLTATCSFNKKDLALVDCVVRSWMKLCPESSRCLLQKGAMDKGTVWCLQYVSALTSLTSSMLATSRQSANTVKILHVVSRLIEKGNVEVKLILTEFLLKQLKHTCRDENKHLINTLLTCTFTSLLQDTDITVQNKVWNDLRKYKEHSSSEKLLIKILNSEASLQDKWHNLIRKDIPEHLPLKEHLIFKMDYQFNHKCMEYLNVIELSDSVSVEKTSSNNFDFADIDTLFEVESDSEPACKKVKLDTNEAADIITRLEKDVSLLCNVKENIVTSDCKVRIRVLCEKLVNIIN